MLAEGQGLLETSPQLVFFPGAAIVLTVLGFTLLGDALRDAMDPKSMLFTRDPGPPPSPRRRSSCGTPTARGVSPPDEGRTSIIGDLVAPSEYGAVSVERSGIRSVEGSPERQLSDHHNDSPDRRRDRHWPGGGRQRRRRRQRSLLGESVAVML